jgi:tRNA(Ile)-lysidine synthase
MLFKRFKQFILSNCLVSKGDTVILAVSGGPDSLCLLHLFNRMADQYRLKLVVAHLNHQLRPEAGDEETGVAALASGLGLPFEAETVDIRSYKKQQGLSEEAAGREARYRFLHRIARKYNAAALALGHHRDDQAETVLLNILRGCGTDGLAGMLPLSSYQGIRLVRPLLGFQREEIEAYCREKGLNPYTDSSNLEKEYRRNRLRLELIPHLAKCYNPQIKEALAGLADLAAADRLFLHSMASKKAGEIVFYDKNRVSLILKNLVELPEALSGRVIRLALRHFQSRKEYGRNHISQLLEMAVSQKPGGKLTLPGGLTANLYRNRLVIIKEFVASNGKLVATELKIPGMTLLPGKRGIYARIGSKGDLTWPPPAYCAYLDYQSLPVGKMMIRGREPGDRFHPQGAGGSKKLKDFLIDRKIDKNFRDWLPLVTIGKEIIWVAGIRIAHPYRITEATEKILILEYKSFVNRKKPRPFAYR